MMEEYIQQEINPVRNNPTQRDAEPLVRISNGVKCTVFLETDRVIQNIISKYWKANSKERQNYLQDILLEVKALLSCSKYNPANSDCLECHYILRKILQEYNPHSSLHSNVPVQSQEEGVY